ncbi:hypothetical protein JCM10207_002366 [Rhodosporidiobolus poonsookiae]
MDSTNPQREHSPTRPPPQQPPLSPHLPPNSLSDLYATLAAPFDEVPARNAPLDATHSPPSPAKPLLAGLLGSSPPKPPHRAVTAPVPPSPIKRARPEPPLKSGTDTLVVGAAPEKARSVSLGQVEKKGAGRSREQSKAGTVSENDTQPPPRKKERAYMEKLKLYETKTKVYIIGCDENETRFRVLKIDRVAPPRPSTTPAGPGGVDEDDGLAITEDPTIYSRQQKDELIETLKAGNGGSIKVAPDPRRYRDDGWHPFFYGIIGFSRFSSSYRLVLVTHRHKCALLGGHYIYASEGTQLYTITPAAVYSADDIKPEQAFSSVHLTKNFFFSYTYDLTNTLQRNLLRGDSVLPPNDKFAWNHYLSRPLRKALQPDSPWLLSLVNGYVHQAKIDVFGRVVFVTLIGRRSRHFAGVRYHKRGINDQGWVANDVESEQIVSETLTTPFYTPAPPSSPHDWVMSPQYTSFVQVRGSIPLYWSQDTSKGVIKPEMQIALPDPFFAPAAKHFEQLFEAYGGQVTVINLIKQNDNRESLLLPDFRQCMTYLNQFLPDAHKMEYIEFDMSASKKKHASASASQTIEAYAEAAIKKTQFFHSGGEAPRRTVPDDLPDDHTRRTVPQLQKGVVRTNCIDCLDRTNSAQTLIAYVALGHQLYALGITGSKRLAPDCEAGRMLEDLFRLHGDVASLQYTGSLAINTLESFKDPQGHSQWQSRSRDTIENLKRLYANSFSDADKQAAIDLFLGITPPLAPAASFEWIPPAPRTSYQHWFTPSHLTALDLPPDEIADRLQKTVDAELALADESGEDGEMVRWWSRYYRTRNWSTFAKMHPFKMDSTLKGDEHLFVPDDQQNPFTSRRAGSQLRKPGSGIRNWLPGRHPAKSARQSRYVSGAHGVLDDSASITSSAAPAAPSLPAAPFSASTAQVATALLAPVVRADEAREYDAWTSQFRHLSLAAQDHLSEKDRALYGQHAAVSVADVSEKDRVVFSATVAAGTPARGFKVEAGGGAGKR